MMLPQKQSKSVLALYRKISFMIILPKSPREAATVHSTAAATTTITIFPPVDTTAMGKRDMGVSSGQKMWQKKLGCKYVSYIFG